MIGTVNYERGRQVPTPRQFGRLPFEFVAFTAADGDSNLDSAARRFISGESSARSASWRCR